jgi:hypothetical protein
MAGMEEIIQHARNGQLEDWVDAFLRAEGNNVPLADGLKKQKRYWIGPLQFPLQRLRRCCGPEEEMEYRVFLEDWNQKVGSLVEYIKSGGELPPFIVQYRQGIFSIRDGTHRFGACERLGRETCWTLIWCDSKEAFEEMKAAIPYRGS